MEEVEKVEEGAMEEVIMVERVEDEAKEVVEKLEEQAREEVEMVEKVEDDAVEEVEEVKKEKDEALREKLEKNVPSPVFIKKRKNVTNNTRTFRQPQEKRKRSSFLYDDWKKTERKRFCVCQKPNDGRKYWCCDHCNQWFHPGCLGKREEEEEETFFCPSCEKTEPEIEDLEDLEDIEDLGSDEEGTNTNVENSRRICGKTALKVYPRAVEHLKEVLCCVNTDCKEEDHQRHIKFCTHPLDVLREQKKKFSFGRHYFSQTTVEVLTEKLLSELLYQVPDKKNPVTSLPSAMVRYVPKKSVLWNLLIYHKLLASQYIIHVIRKELLIIIATIELGAPYEMCEANCMETEMDSKVVFGI